MSADLNGALLNGEALAQAETETHSEVGQSSATVATGEHGEAGGLPPFLRFDPGVWIWTMLVFVALLLILKKIG